MDELLEHAADAGFFQTEDISEPTRRDAWTGIDLDQGVDRRWGQLRTGESAPHEPEFADKSTGGRADLFDGGRLCGHFRAQHSCMVQPYPR
ncbi:protein of unknown function (plasmid) [Azospirillum baldaniorum]|uniref:Uncharacterized protein n=1 Tax=Azospirillum baldaniorum TaxID=1064539 RepID=A0A9P1K122_9PROT|nr:protein of unknown function [Azospirillum baldaniorum]